MLRYLFYALLIYLAYRFIFHFIIPVFKTTRQLKRQFREMNSRMNRSEGSSSMDDFMHQSSYTNTSANNHRARQQTTTQQTDKSKEQPGDYIEFEEVK